MVSAKLASAGGLILPAGVIVFPLSYALGDVVTEVYGYATVRRIIWLGFACNLLMVAVIWLAGHLPPAPVWKGQAAFSEVFAQTPRILAASFLAYLGGSFANSYVLAKLKIVTQGRWLWTRTLGSTVVGQGLDSLIFVVLAFAARGAASGAGRDHPFAVARQGRLRGGGDPDHLHGRRLAQGP